MTKKFKYIVQLRNPADSNQHVKYLNTWADANQYWYKNKDQHPEWDDNIKELRVKDSLDMGINSVFDIKYYFKYKTDMMLFLLLFGEAFEIVND